MFTVSVDELLKHPDRTLRYRENWSPESFDLKHDEAALADDVKVEFELRNESGTIHATGEVETRLSLTCGRCLSDFHRRVRTTVSVEFVTDSSDHEEPFEEKIYLLEFDGKKVNLAEPVRQDLVLHVPMQPLCREDCRGLCSVCGADLNEEDCGHDQKSIDPRLEALQDIELSSEQ